MNYTVSFDVVALVILLIFMIYLIAQRQTRDRSNLILIWTLAVSVLSAIGEIVFVAMVSSGLSGHGFSIVANAAKYLYFMPHNMIFSFYVLYTYASFDIWHKFRNNRILVGLWWAIVIIGQVTALSNLFTHKVFEIGDDLVYHRGYLIAIFYMSGFCYAVWTFIVLLRYREMANRSRRVTLFLIYPIVLTSIVIQYIFPRYRANMFGLAIAFTLFMLVVQRSEYQKDLITGAMNIDTAISRIKSALKMEKPVTLTFIKIVNHGNLQMYLGQDEYAGFLHMMTDFLSGIAHKHNYPVDIYYLNNGLYAFMADEDDINLAIPVAEDIKESLMQEMISGEFAVRTDARICLVRCPEDVDEFSTIFTLATTFHDTMADYKDVILYAEHKNDRNFMIRNEIGDIIDRALEQGNLYMCYQPIFSTLENRFVSAEALIRLHDDKYGDIPPGVFIPMAEANGRIHAIGDFVLHNVLDFISRIDIDRLGLRYIEFNLSASQCIEVDLVDKIMNLIDEKGIRPSNISLELTENAADINPAIVDANVWKLHDAGIRFALDDYGTGYSNIKRVTSLPVAQVKLDKSFVDEIDNPQMWIVIEDTIAMLKEMGKEILVEGVETAETAGKLSEIDADLLQGCELMQGFLFCRPLPEEEFVKFIEDRLEN